MGVHKIAEKPAVRGGQIVIRQLMNLSISVDHRIADGYDGAMFLQEVKTYLEDPTLMYVSRGLAGQHPLRFFCRPEVTWITLRAG